MLCLYGRAPLYGEYTCGRTKSSLSRRVASIAAVRAFPGFVHAYVSRIASAANRLSTRQITTQAPVGTLIGRLVTPDE